MWDDLPTFMVALRCGIGVALLLLVPMQVGMKKRRLLAFLLVSIAILLDLTDGPLANRYGLNLPFQDGIGDGLYIIGGFLFIYLDDKDMNETHLAYTRPKLSRGLLISLGVIWAICAIAAFTLSGSNGSVAMALLHLYYMGAGIWLWYELAMRGLPKSLRRYVPVVAIALAIIVATLDSSRISDFINGRP